MKRAATHSFKRQSKNHAFFPKLSNFYFDLRPAPGKTPGQDRGAKTPTPEATRMLQITRGRQGGGEGWSGLELTDALCEPAFFVHIIKRRSITFVQLVNYPVQALRRQRPLDGNEAAVPSKGLTLRWQQSQLPSRPLHGNLPSGP